MSLEGHIFYWTGFITLFILFSLISFGLLEWLYWRIQGFREKKEIWQEGLRLYQKYHKDD